MDNIFKFKSKDEIKRRQLLGKGAVIWFTGLSGSGKSTIAAELEKVLLSGGMRAYLLDGDNVRLGLNSDLDFSSEGRAENVRRLYCVASLFADSGTIAIVSAISPFNKDREKAKEHCRKNACSFVEIFVDTPIEECIKRDTKGLYKKAVSGEIKDFTGISSPYEKPEDADIIIETLKTPAKKAAREVADYIEALLSIKEMTEYLCKAAKEAGDKIMEIYKRDFTVEYKEDKSPLTEADLLAERLIRKRLLEKYPDIAILSEESTDDLKRLKNPCCFIVDPLDGTKEFVKKNGEFTVNIGFSYFGKSILGVVYAPALRRLFYAAVFEGAYEYDFSGRYFTEKTAIKVSDRKENLKVMTSRSHLDDETKELLQRNAGKIGGTIKAGSSLKGCLIAAGEADIYYRTGYTMEWDTCAMQCIVEEAGGVFLEGDGSAMRYNRENSLNKKGFYILNNIENKFI